jgi:hypothetical protein
LSLEEFRKQFEYLVQYEPPPLAFDSHMGGFLESESSEASGKG